MNYNGIVKFEVVEAVSKNGKPYYQLRLLFDFGYEMTIFLNNEQAFILKNQLSK